MRAAPGGVVYALRSSYAAPPHPVRIDPDGIVTALPCVEHAHAARRLDRADGDRRRRHDGPVLADAARERRQAPAPLVLWIHGGPLGSWNAWHWRWNPWLLTARGYAVLMPDPALSTGYGQDFIQRGWGAWGVAPYTDLMAATDAACAHPRVDETRTAAMGGSFGGYMANWIAGHTDRFDAIVTHASLWALDQFGPTTDGAYWWEREMTPEMSEENSPHRHVEADQHADAGHPRRQGLSRAHRRGAAAVVRVARRVRACPRPTTAPARTSSCTSRPRDHWVLAPQHAKIWYQVVTAFLARHVARRATSSCRRRSGERRPTGRLGHDRRQREFDIVLYGATGFVGKLTADYLADARRRRRASRWPAGPPDKLLAVRDTLGDTAQSLAADRRGRLVSRRR